MVITIEIDKVAETTQHESRLVQISHRVLTFLQQLRGLKLRDIVVFQPQVVPLELLGF